MSDYITEDELTEAINILRNFVNDHHENVDDPDETPEGLSEDSLNLLLKIDEWEKEEKYNTKRYDNA